METRSARLTRSLERALGFIEASRNPNGLWSDFLTLAGESVYWVSGYVGYSLSRHWGAKRAGWLETEVASKIRDQEDRGGGWGYGPGVPPDADSTSWCLLFLSMLGTHSRESREKASNFLLSHQSPIDGGFRTYAAPNQVGRYMMLDQSVSFDGWASSQTCVTGVAVQALIQAGAQRGIKEAVDYIRRTQTAEGYWNPYWWSDQLYATVNCMEALKTPGGSNTGVDCEILERAQDWIGRTQLVDGGWSNSSSSSTNGGLPFSTALAIRGLMLAPESPRVLEMIRKGEELLLAQQLPDGGWSSHHILRIPHPSMKEPWEQPEWKRDGRAINAVIRDQRRLYTTATVLTALSELKRRSSEVK